jgi:c-di-GMP-binding flagellar brake protein YcgR
MVQAPAMFEDTRPTELGAQGEADAWAPFRVSDPKERQALLRQLCDGQVPVMLAGPDGASLTTTLWSVDSAQGRLSFTADAKLPALERLVEGDECVAVAYLDSVKLQFDLHGLMVVRAAKAATLQCTMPQAVYRLQRRNAYRVRTAQRHAPTARLRHPSMPDMVLSLRVLDVSIGGCALWLPHDVPALQPGTHIAEVSISLDAETRFTAGLQLQHVTSLGTFHNHGAGEIGVRLGCEWQRLAGSAERELQRWIDQSQKRRWLLSLE